MLPRLYCLSGKGCASIFPASSNNSKEGGGGEASLTADFLPVCHRCVNHRGFGIGFAKRCVCKWHRATMSDIVFFGFTSKKIDVTNNFGKHPTRFGFFLKETPTGLSFNFSV
eukprot:scaffold25413_cov113-Cylindrotheca_fusiformis.AAC.1